ncbi:MAG: hypothetical protein IJQ31_00630 [Thermoguttaceae bacterium]|nr:hypothetical protein [Thermoguttaceae bacterium]
MNLSAQKFIENWRNRGDEKSDTQQFWTALLHDVYGIEHPENFIRFEQRVKLKNVSFMDATIPFTGVLIEQKSSDVDLDKKIHQSDGSELTPLEQAKRYDYNLPKSQRHRWIIACNFREFRIFDTENPTAAPVHVLLENLEKDWHVMDFLVDKTQTKAQQEQELSIAAGELVGKLYDALLTQYRDPTSPETLRSLNILCVRLVFCFYAEDADIFGKHNCVCTYLAKRKHDMRRALIDLFHILNQKQEERDEYLDDDLLAFPYVNGGLFEGDVEIPRITPEIAELLTEECSRNFDWSGIDPTIFGAVFESTLNPETRRSGGMHYTSTKNIHRVIDPLFFSDLQNELTDILAIPVEKTREKRLKDFRRHLASLTFFDPACGSGNFLTETYLSIRRLENKILRTLMKGQMQMSDVAIQVGIDQFYGIEINDFAVSVARTALWIAESQMLKETEGIINRDLNFLPLHTQAHIVEGNALRLDWETIVPRDRLSYIIGNPPFVGARFMSPEQKNDLVKVFGEDWKNVGNLDYVCAWYKKAMDLISGTGVHSAFVSTNSICQGEQVPNLWKPLFERGLKIDFAWRTFRWDSEATLKAHVHCVIVGFSHQQEASPDQLLIEASPERGGGPPQAVEGFRKQDSFSAFQNPPASLRSAAPLSVGPLNAVGGGQILFKASPERGGGPEGRRGSEAGESPSLGQNPPASLRSAAPLSGGPLKRVPVIYDEKNGKIPAKTINPYLIDAPMIFIESRNKPICHVPEIGIGNKPIDGGNYLFKDDEKEEFVKKEPESEKYFRRWYGSDEFINNRPRWCLWLGDCPPHELKRMKYCLERVENVRVFRLASKSEGTRKIAQFPTRFHVENMPKTNYLLIPRVSSEKRWYVPIGFMTSNELTSDSAHIIPDATLYHFGILTSWVHMAWMRAVCGRLEMRYRYSKDIVYNNFPWPLAQEASPERGGAPEGRRGSETGENPSFVPNPPASLRSAAPLSGGPLNAAIERTAQGILDARALYPDSSLADLYDENTMPAELRNAHKANDQAVLAAYGFPKNITEPEIVAELMKRYQELTDGRR